MKKLTKKYVLVYDEESKQIVFNLHNNSREFPTYPSGDFVGAEFDTEQELEDYISENGLVE